MRTPQRLRSPRAAFAGEIDISSLFDDPDPTRSWSDRSKDGVLHTPYADGEHAANEREPLVMGEPSPSRPLGRLAEGLQLHVVDPHLADVGAEDAEFEEPVG